MGNWSLDHQLMLNSFLQERFLMANLVKNVNLELEKSKNIAVKREEALRKYQSDNSTLEGYLTKLRSSVTGGISGEQQTLIANIFREFEGYASTRSLVEPMMELGELKVTDSRIQSLLR